jgi:hypothetical protein
LDGVAVKMPMSKRIGIWLDNLWDRWLIAIGRSDRVEPTHVPEEPKFKLAVLIVRKSDQGTIVESVWSSTMAAINEIQNLNSLFPDRQYFTLFFKVDYGIDTQ